MDLLPVAIYLHLRVIRRLLFLYRTDSLLLCAEALLEQQEHLLARHHDTTIATNAVAVDTVVDELASQGQIPLTQKSTAWVAKEEIFEYRTQSELESILKGLHESMASSAPYGAYSFEGSDLPCQVSLQSAGSAGAADPVGTSVCQDIARFLADHTSAETLVATIVDFLADFAVLLDRTARSLPFSSAPLIDRLHQVIERYDDTSANSDGDNDGDNDGDDSA